MVVLQIGAGGVGSVVAHKMAMNSRTFHKVVLASRSVDKCRNIQHSIRQKGYGDIVIDRVDARCVNDLIDLIRKHRPYLVLNVALPYQNLSIMRACVATKTHYLDTANYEHPDKLGFEYKEQWNMDRDFRDAGIFGLLGSGFDPGVTNVFCSYAKKHFFDEIEFIDILDCNDGDHGYAFATNFNPEINLREVSSDSKFWASDDFIASNHSLNFDLRRDDVYCRFDTNAHIQHNLEQSMCAYNGGKWVTSPPLNLMKEWDYPGIGLRKSYLMYHEELESLVRHIEGLKRIRFFMTFSDSYLTHMKCLENVGMLGVKELDHDGVKVVPIQFLKTLLPDPASLAGRTKGKTNIGCYITGRRCGRPRTIYIYNVCQHERCYDEVGAQAVSYTTGVPAMIGAKLVCENLWGGRGVFNMEQNDPDFFMRELGRQGLPWEVLENGQLVDCGDEL